MPRIPVSMPQFPPDTLTLTGQDAIHVRNVLRMQPGDLLCLFDGRGNEYDTRITAVDGTGVHLRLCGARRCIPDSPVHLDIAIALLKEKKIDDLIRPLTELGVRTLRIFSAKRSVPVLREDKVKARLERWQRLATEALKQCGAGHMPDILFHDTLSPLLEDGQEHEMRILFWESTRTSPWPDPHARPSRIRAVFGPEGGFETSEVEAFQRAGYEILGLGPRILKAPTAVLAGSALLQFRYGDLSHPPQVPFFPPEDSPEPSPKSS